MGVSSVGSGTVARVTTGAELAVEDEAVVNAVGSTGASSFERSTSVADSAEWPSGTPESRTKTRIEETPLEVSQADKLATITAVMDGESAQNASALVNTPPGVSEASLDAAYEMVLEARSTPGSKWPSVVLEQLPTMNDSGNVQVAGGTRYFATHLEVDEAGKVNGAYLPVDELARLSSEVSTVPLDVKGASLRDAGLSEAWVTNATAEQIDYAVAKLRQASLTPGSHTLDLTYTRTLPRADATTMEMPGVLTFSVSASGEINGALPLIETALATQLTMERYPMAAKQLMLEQLGLPEEALAGINPAEAASVLTRVAMLTREPGEHAFEFTVGGQAGPQSGEGQWLMGLKIGPTGEIEGAGAVKLPPEPALWKGALSSVFALASLALPEFAPIFQSLSAGLTLTAQTGSSLQRFAALVSAGAGVSGMADMAAGAGSVSTTTSTLSSMASLLGTTDRLVQGIKQGNVLGLFSAVVDLAELGGSLTKTDLGADFDALKQAGTAAGYADAIRSGNFEGLFSQVAGDLAGTTLDEIESFDELGFDDLRFVDASGDAFTVGDSNVDKADKTALTGLMKLPGGSVIRDMTKVANDAGGSVEVLRDNAGRQGVEVKFNSEGAEYTYRFWNDGAGSLVPTYRMQMVKPDSDEGGALTSATFDTATRAPLSVATGFMQFAPLDGANTGMMMVMTQQLPAAGAGTKLSYTLNLNEASGSMGGIVRATPPGGVESTANFRLTFTDSGGVVVTGSVVRPGAAPEPFQAQLKDMRAFEAWIADFRFPPGR